MKPTALIALALFVIALVVATVGCDRGKPAMNSPPVNPARPPTAAAPTSPATTAPGTPAPAAAIRALKPPAVPLDPMLGGDSGGKVTMLDSAAALTALVGPKAGAELARQVDFAAERVLFVSWGTGGPPFGTLRHAVMIEGTPPGTRVIEFWIKEPPGRIARGEAWQVGADFFAAPRGVTAHFRPPPAAAPLPAPVVMSEREKIERMLDLLARSDAVFIRGGVEYDGAKAAAHLRTKWSAAGDRVKTARDFIDHLASASSATGRPYQIRRKNGSVVPSREWFDELLASIVAVPSPTIAPFAPAEQRAITSERLESHECGTIARLHTLGGVFLASQPKPEDFAQAKKGGVKTVINLRHAAEIEDFDEQKVVEAEGLIYINLPWDGPGELTDGIFDQAREQLKTAVRPILLHCSSANRVGAVWLPYRVLDDGLSWDDALAEAKTVGLKSPDYEAKAKDYIQRHAK